MPYFEFVWSQVEVGIVRQFPFSSTLQRMAIICKRIGQEQLHFFCKGSPEMVQSLCKPETGKLPDFPSLLTYYDFSQLIF
jgi:magnesium-transporting ATPase (P-type)